MKRIGSLQNFITVLPSNEKFLVLIDYPQLIDLEKLLKVKLGVTNEKKKRPAILWKEAEESKEFFYLVFLTASKKTSVSVDLDFCPNKNSLCKKFWFYRNSYVFQTLDQKLLAVKIKDVALISKIIYCGFCEDLDHLNKMNFIEI
ncbi:MAG: hypothetical protein PWP33_747 [Thermodesulfobacterium sp.]|nr:hypothetical protein [Thermodesulfobacterium sp.]